MFALAAVQGECVPLKTFSWAEQCANFSKKENAPMCYMCYKTLQTFSLLNVMHSELKEERLNA